MSSDPEQRNSPSWPRWVWELRPLALAALMLPMGCTSIVVPPISPVEPVAVFLLDHGRTSSLVLPAPDGSMTRYVYGDWNWYALRNTGVIDGLRALFWPTEGTLGRRHLAGPPYADIVRQQVRAETITHLFPVIVGRAEVERLRLRLDEEHRSGRQLAVIEALDLEFVPHPHRYSYFYNSNHAVAGWLRELGCKTHGLAFHSQWRVEGR